MEPATPFDLNEALHRWRDQLSGLPAFAGKDLEELEGHLRDSVADFVPRGLTEEEAFLVASRRLSAGPALAREYGKVYTERVWIERSIWMVVGMLAIGAITSVSNLVGNLAALAVSAWLPTAGWSVLSGVLVYVATSVGVGVLAWRRMTRGTGVARSFPGSLATRPVAAAALAAAVTILLMAVSMGSMILVISAQPAEVVGAAQVWRQYGILAVTLGLYPTLLGWLLARRARHQAAAP